MLKNVLKKAELKDEVSAVAAAVETVTAEIVSCFDEETDAARRYLRDQNGPHGGVLHGWSTGFAA